jgi:FkbM family methyltransferase
LDRIALKSAEFAARWLPVSIQRAIYRFPLLARLIRSRLNQAAPVGLVPVQIAAGYLAGKSMILDLQSEKDYWLGTYELELQTAIREWMKPGMVVYDVGANIGYITFMMAMATGQTGHVFAFEALPANTKRLVENIALNDLTERITVLNCAVINEPGKTSFWIGPSDDTGKAEGSAGRDEISYRDSIQVDGISLDWFVFTMNNPAPDLVKIDIEGGEVLALPGMERLLVETQPIILIELHGTQSARVTWETLTKCGYEIKRMEKGYQSVRSIDELDWKSYLIAIAGHKSG